MAKNEKRKFEYMAWNQEFLNNGHPLNMEKTKTFLKVMLSQDKSLLQPWHEDFTCSWCPVLIGEKGCGKSTLIKDIARSLNYELRRIMMGDSMDEDNLGVIKRDYDEDGHHGFSLPKWMPITEPKGNGGIAFIDEAGTGSSTHQNMLATLLTDGYDNGYYGHTVKKGWFWVAATNPDEIQYHLNQQLDERVRDRMFPIYVRPDSHEVLYHLSKYNKIPKSVQGFLMMNETHIDQVSARTWETVGRYVARNEQLRLMNKDMMLNTLRWNLPPGTVEAFSQYLARGNDANAYPMSAKEIMGADETTHEEHCNRMKYWAKKGHDSLISATVFDLRLFMSDENAEYTDKEMDNLTGIIKLIPNTDLASDMLDSVGGKNSSLHRRLLDRFDASDPLTQKLFQMQKRHTARKKAS